MGDELLERQRRHLEVGRGVGVRQRQVQIVAGAGRSRLTMSMPSSSDTSDAETNHSIALRPIRPIALVSPICATPTTSVENTKGAMIILMRRRKMSVISDM